MGPIGFPELLFILVLALLLFGPRSLPQIGRTIGRGLAEFRRASTELQRTLNTEMIEEELRKNDPRKVVRDSLAEAERVARGEPDAEPEPAPPEAERVARGEPDAEPEPEKAASSHGGD